MAFIKEVFMCNTIKYKASQDSDTKLISISVFRKNGEAIDDWIMYEKLEDLTVEELRYLRDYLCVLFKKKKDT